MNKLLVIGIFGFLFLIARGFLFYNQSKSKNLIDSSPPLVSSPTAVINQADERVDYQASFAIFTNGILRVFTSSMYHNLSQVVFIQADNPNIIHVKKTGVAWNDFFETLPFKLTYTCLTTGTKETFCTNDNKSLKFYLNGFKTDDLLEREIRPGDKALISYGNETEKDIQKQMNKISID